MKVKGLFQDNAKAHAFKAGQVIFTVGDPGDTMYGIISGEVEIFMKNKLLAQLTADDVFGEMALIDRTPRSATAIAKTDCSIAVLDEHRFLFLVQETPLFALHVMSTMAERLRRMNELVLEG